MIETAYEGHVDAALATPLERRILLRAALLGAGAAAASGLLAGCGENDAPAPVPPSTEGVAPIETGPSLGPVETPDLSRKQSYNEIVRGLGGIEERCGRKVFAGPMVFFDIPANDAELRERMAWHPGTLTQIKEAGFDSPVVILEPAGALLTGLGQAAARTKAWATALKARGIGTEHLGPVVVEPEPVVGGLKGGNARQFVASVNNYRAELEHQFPGIESTILIDTAPEERSKLVAALRRERLGMPLQSAGIQAYSNGSPIRFDATGRPDLSHYLTADAITEIAEAADVQHIWLNTGLVREDANDYSYGRYTREQRIAIASAVADILETVRDRGIETDRVVLFAENKLAKPVQSPEKRDFSLHPGDEPVLITLHDRLRAMGIPLFGFDVA